MSVPTARHSRSALIFLIAAIAAALVSMPLLRAVGMVLWPVFVIAWLINLGAAWHLAQWARQQRRSAWAFGLPAASLPSRSSCPGLPAGDSSSTRSPRRSRGQRARSC